MKKTIALTLLSLFGNRQGYSTANGVADDLAAFKKEVESQQAEAQARIDLLVAHNNELQKQLDSHQSAAAKTVKESELNIGPFRLPEGLDKRDVLWRVAAGLDVTQAVTAALAQKNYDETQAKTAEASK